MRVVFPSRVAGRRFGRPRLTRPSVPQPLVLAGRALRGMWAGAAGLRGSCARLQALRGGHGAAFFPGRAQALHTSVASHGSKNLLKKFASKTRKKFWYEGPSLGSHLTHKPSKFEFLMKSTLKKTRKEDTVRLRVLNGLLYKALTELLCTPAVSQEVYDLNVELSKVSVTSDFSACRVYWKIGVSADQNRHTEAVLQRSAAYIRHLLMSQQTLRNVPPIVFIQDKKDILLAEVDRLLAVADFGPPDERDGLALDCLRNPEALSSHDAQEPATHPNLCGIDHEALNKQIMEYKRKKEKGLQCMNLAQPSGQELVPDLTHLLRRRKKTSSRRHQDTSPRSFLLGEEAEDEEEEDNTTEYGCQAHEAEEDWEAEARGDGVQQGPCGKREQR
ncbi:putative ribosome-binding factor A, mitochondrial isoform X1 [Cricetulus griseus]|uniref:Ribosome binding factor A n=2 Tax=Cricetulus griseus TaxID=10029 RepID=A0A8C2N0S3_CRIGR|nr:putative ribosome-binding factor A, mitochondrial isoform X1 [Cricetulus griseus]XP_027259457.1 putative ribosome-binding factor A, mitochondrial isoform X2 [Cricetulus griseus]